MSINEIDNDKHEIDCSKVNTKMKKCQLRVNKKTRETEYKIVLRSNAKRRAGSRQQQQLKAPTITEKTKDLKTK